jgi:hypothetical protein
MTDGTIRTHTAVVPRFSVLALLGATAVVALLASLLRPFLLDQSPTLASVRRQLRLIVLQLDIYASVHGEYPTSNRGAKHALQLLVDDARFAQGESDLDIADVEYINSATVRPYSVVVAKRIRPAKGQMTAFVTSSHQFGVSPLDPGRILGSQVTVEGILVPDSKVFDAWKETHPFDAHDFDGSTLTYSPTGKRIQYVYHDGILVRCKLADGTVEYVDMDRYGRLLAFRRD